MTADALRQALGATLYRAGQLQLAIAELGKRVAAAPLSNSPAYERFFLAMAHWQLGNKEEARSWQDQAVAWMEKNKPQDEELRRFRAEAAALLEVKEKTKD